MAETPRPVCRTISSTSTGVVLREDSRRGLVVGAGRRLVEQIGAEFGIPIGIEQGGAGGIGAAEGLHDIGRAGDQLGALLNQRIAALGSRIEGGAGDGEDVAVLLQRQAGGDQRAGAFGGFDDDEAQRQT